MGERDRRGGGHRQRDGQDRGAQPALPQAVVRAARAEDRRGPSARGPRRLAALRRGDWHPPHRGAARARAPLSRLVRVRARRGGDDPRRCGGVAEQRPRREQALVRCVQHLGGLGVRSRRKPRLPGELCHPRPDHQDVGRRQLQRGADDCRRAAAAGAPRAARGHHPARRVLDARRQRVQLTPAV